MLIAFQLPTHNSTEIKKLFGRLAEFLTCYLMYLRISTLGDFTEIVLGTGGYSSKEDLFGNPASQCHTHTV